MKHYSIGDDDMEKKYSQDDNLLIQSYCTIAFLIELNRDKFLESEHYKKMNIEDSFVKKFLPSIGIENQGALLMSLYVMLVLPKQLIQKDFPCEFEELNRKVHGIKKEAHSTYENDFRRIDYIRHIRNAVAHGRVSFIPKETVTFTDEHKNKTCSITIPLDCIGLFLTELQKIFLKHIQKIESKNNT